MCRWIDTKTNERKESFSVDIAGYRECLQNNKRTQNIGQDVAEHDASISCADGTSGLNIFFFTHRKNLTPRNTGLRFPACEANANHDEKQATELCIQLTNVVSKCPWLWLGQSCAKESHEQDDEEQTGESVEHVHNTHHDIVNAATKETGDTPVDDTNKEADDRANKSDCQ